MAEGIKLRIGPFEAGCMVAVALIVDGIQALLTFLIIGIFLNWLISLFAYMTFWWWFSQRNVSFTRSGTILGIGLAVELIPVLDALPAWTLDVALLIGSVYAEDVVASISPEMADALAKVTSGDPTAASNAADQKRSEQLRANRGSTVYNNTEGVNNNPPPKITDVKPKEKLPGVDDFDFGDHNLEF